MNNHDMEKLVRESRIVKIYCVAKDEPYYVQITKNEAYRLIRIGAFGDNNMTMYQDESRILFIDA